MARDEMGLKPESLLKLATQKDQMALSRLLTLVEKDLKKAAPFLAKLKTRSGSVRLGITGPPGAGKSSLINCLVKIYRENNLRVAILAIDPSSPFSGGAILGDRVRMTSHSEDKNVFIRSLGSRGGFGGLSSATGAMATVLEAVGFDVIIIETVGVGQTELQIMNLADATCVVLVPESGDVIQTLKAGILEIADLFVVNKSDRPGAEILVNELKSLVEMEGERKREVLLTSATKNEGVETLSEKLLYFGKKLKGGRRNSPERLNRELQNLVLWSVQENLQSKILNLKISNVYSAFQKFKIPK
jgi:LAO/AO transport system kinase